MAPPLPIAYFKIGGFSHINRSVERLLSDSFPGRRVVTFDVTHDLFQSRLKAVGFLTLAAVMEYGGDILIRGRGFDCGFYTTRYFRKVRELARAAVAPGDYAFSFQTQSLFDASIPGLSHFVYTDHTHLANLEYPDFDPRALCSPAWIALEKEIYHNARRVFTMSRNIRRSVIEHYGCPADKVVCVFGGSNVPFKPETAGKRDYAAGKILFNGVDWERKGGPDLLRAFEQVRQRHPKAELIVLGASPPIRSPGVRVVGRVPLDQVAEFYREASIFCLPTWREPFGIAFLEAMLHRLPVIGTDIGGIPDFIEEGINGFRIKPGDIPTLAGTLEKLLDSPALCRQFGEQGFAIASERYTWEKTGERIREQILGCLGQGMRDET